MYLRVYHSVTRSAAASRSQPSANSRERLALAAGAIADDDPGEADLRVLGAPRLHELVERSLADRVGAQSGPGRGERGADRREVGGRALGLGEVGDGGPRDLPGADHVGVEGPVPLVDVVVDELGQLADPRGVHEPVDPAEVLGRGRDRRCRPSAGRTRRRRWARRPRRLPWPLAPGGPGAGPATPPRRRAGRDPWRSSGRGRSTLRRRRPAWRSLGEHRQRLPPADGRGAGLHGVVPVDLPAVAGSAAAPRRARCAPPSGRGRRPGRSGCRSRRTGGGRSCGRCRRSRRRSNLRSSRLPEPLMTTMALPCGTVCPCSSTSWVT